VYQQQQQQQQEEQHQDVENPFLDPFFSRIKIGFLRHVHKCSLASYTIHRHSVLLQHKVALERHTAATAVHAAAAANHLVKGKYEKASEKRKE
jgi:hypothetical protein